MRRIDRFAVFVSLFLGGCVSGTSTESENTVTGYAVLSDGQPAAGAVLTARSSVFMVSDGVPAWTSVAADTADSLGRFKVRIPRAQALYLEIRQGNTALTPGVKAEVCFSVYPFGVRRPDSLGTFRLLPSGSIKGRIAPKSVPSLSGYWVGIFGSSAMVKLAPDSLGGYPFVLEGLYPGLNQLTLATLKGVVNPSTSDTGGNYWPAPWARVESDSTSDMGSIPF